MLRVQIMAWFRVKTCVQKKIHISVEYECNFFRLFCVSLFRPINMLYIQTNYNGKVSDRNCIQTNIYGQATERGQANTLIWFNSRLHPTSNSWFIISNLLYVLYYYSGMKCCVAAGKRLHVLCHSEATSTRMTVGRGSVVDLNRQSLDLGSISGSARPIVLCFVFFSNLLYFHWKSNM